MMDKFKISEEHAKGILGEMQDSGVVDWSVPRKVAIKDEEALRKALTRYRNSTVGRPVDTVGVPVEANSEGTPIVPIRERKAVWLEWRSGGRTCGCRRRRIGI